MLFLALTACTRFEPSSPGEDSTPPATDDSGETGTPPDAPVRVAWGDVHNHTNLSQDGCEDSEAACGPDSFLPGEAVFANAQANGLDFAAMTDHAEFSRYQRDADAVDLDVWD